jgi:adenosylmethionine-8-amino-7-oxononanoate aminotransferase
MCEPVSAAALPGYTPPESFWNGLAERRERHGFLICFDEVVTGMGRTGSWFAAQQLPIEPDVITGGKGLGAGYAPLAATLCTETIYEALAEGSRNFEHGHTWDGAPLPCAVGLAVLDALTERKLIERVRERGPSLRDQLEQAVGSSEIVKEVRGRGFLLGVEFVDPRDGESLLPDELDAGALVDQRAFEHGLLVTSTHSTADGFTGDQTLLAPAFIATDEELAEMVERFAATVADVEEAIKQTLTGAGV